MNRLAAQTAPTTDNADTATQAETSPAKKSVTNALEDLADKRERMHLELAVALEPKVSDYFTCQEATFRTRLNSVVKAHLDAIELRLFDGIDAVDQGLLLLLRSNLEESARQGFSEAQLQIGSSFGFDLIPITQYIDNEGLRHV